MLSQSDLPNAASVAAVVDEVTSGVLGIGTSEASGVVDAASWWSCSVGIGAPTELSLVVRCPESFARRVAEAMVGDGRHGVSDDLLRESLAEFTTMVGGNLKSLVRPLSCAPLSSPVVGDSRAEAAYVFTLRCGDEPLTVALSTSAGTPCVS